MVQSVRTSPHVSAVHEVDMSAVFAPQMEAHEGVRGRELIQIDIQPYIVDAVVKASRKSPSQFLAPTETRSSEEFIHTCGLCAVAAETDSSFRSSGMLSG